MHAHLLLAARREIGEGWGLGAADWNSRWVVALPPLVDIPRVKEDVHLAAGGLPKRGHQVAQASGVKQAPPAVPRHKQRHSKIPHQAHALP